MKVSLDEACCDVADGTVALDFIGMCSTLSCDFFLIYPLTTSNPQVA